ncbi:hypothetical protein [Streptomyces sp. PsTaAH-124]|uniref:hypothetical protein n=1 Tax=Streptomyces sp. PsTaAH-124 TaxID=1157638 RepID=UPI00036DAC65|nr:hypothetical protein [Streptomyces sp. PsTaAH-124]
MGATAGQVLRWGAALALGALWWWAVLRLVLTDGAGVLEAAVAAGGWGLSVLPLHCVGAPSASPGPDRADGGERFGGERFGGERFAAPQDLGGSPWAEAGGWPYGHGGGALSSGGGWPTSGEGGGPAAGTGAGPGLERPEDGSGRCPAE